MCMIKPMWFWLWGKDTRLLKEPQKNQKMKKKQRWGNVWKWISASSHMKNLFFRSDFIRMLLRVCKHDGQFLKRHAGIQPVSPRCCKHNRPHTIVFSKTEACSWLSRVAKYFWSSSLAFDGCRPGQDANAVLKTADTLMAGEYKGYAGCWEGLVVSFKS